MQQHISFLSPCVPLSVSFALCLSIMCLHIGRVSARAVIGSLQPCHLEDCCLFLGSWWSAEKNKIYISQGGAKHQPCIIPYWLWSKMGVNMWERQTKRRKVKIYPWEKFLYQTLQNLVKKNGVCVTLLPLSISRAHIFFLSHQTRYVVALTGIICCQASRDTTTYKQKRESSVNTVHKMPICGLGKE